MSRLSPLALLALAGCPPFIWPQDHGGAGPQDPASTDIECGEYAFPEWDEGTGEWVCVERPFDTGAPGEDTGDPLEPSHWPEPWSYSATFSLAILEGVATGYSEGGTEVPAAAWVTLADDRAVPICTLEYGLYGVSIHPGGTEESLFDVDVSQAEVTLDACAGVLDPEVWGEEPGATLRQSLYVTITRSLPSGQLVDAAHAAFTGTDEEWQATHQGKLVAAWTPLGDSWVEIFYARAMRLEPDVPEVQWVDTDGDGVWGPGEFARFYTIEELQQPPARAAWVGSTAGYVGFGVPLAEVLLP